MLPRDLTGRTWTYRGLAEKESWMKWEHAASRLMLHEPVDLSSMGAQATAESSDCARCTGRSRRCLWKPNISVVTRKS